MFKFNHYIPILRWKAAEKEALRNMQPEIRKHVTPLIELVMPQPEPNKKSGEVKTAEELWGESVAILKKTVAEVPGDVMKCWGQTPIFIDLHLVDGSVRAQALKEVLDAGKELDLFMIPVVNIIPIIDFESDKKTREVASTFARQHKHGLCLRLLRTDLEQPTLHVSIKKFLSETKLTPKDVDIMVDFQIVDKEDLSLTELIQNIPHLSDWRTFTVGGGTFPVDLTQCQLGENFIPRFDWKNWQHIISSKKLKRNPAFADYTIQHPVIMESARFFSPSASIRYTLNNDWLVMRGQKGKRDQYLANAQLLSQHKNFFGQHFSFGDSYIVEKGKDLKSTKTGNPMTWLVAGINHHLACVVTQLSSLSD